MATRFTPLFPLEQVFYTGLAPLINQIMRIGVKSFFAEDSFSDLRALADEAGDECAYARHGAVDGVRSRTDMETVWKSVAHIQDERNQTCTVKNACLAKVNGNCLFYSPDTKKAKKAKAKMKKRT